MDFRVKIKERRDGELGEEDKRRRELVLALGR